MSNPRSRFPQWCAHPVTWTLLALAPPLIVVMVPALMLWASGEFVGPDTAARAVRPESPPALYGLAYSNPTNRYKRLAAYSQSRDVLVLGTSRVLQIRAEAFRPGTHFYNAGQAVANLNGYAPMLEQWPETTLPKLIIAGMDQYFYNERWREDEGDWTGLNEPADSPVKIVEKNWREVWDDYAEKRIPWRALFPPRDGPRFIGLSARVHRAGFRNDGSYRYGRQISALQADPGTPFDPDQAFDDTFDRIRQGERRYEFASEIHPRSLEDTRRFLAAAQARGIQVVGFLPPYAHAVWERMMSMGDKYGYMRRLPSDLHAVFDAFGFALFDFQDLAATGADDREAIDGFHPGERATLRMLAKMARSHPGLAEYVNPDALEEAIRKAPNPYEVFPD